MNDLFSAKFFYSIPDNYIKISINDLGDKYYHLIMTDDDDEMYYSFVVESGFWYNFNFNVFKYKFKLLEFDGDEIRVILEDKFDIRYHNFNIALISDDKEEIKIWKYYLWLVQLKINCKFNIIVNKNFVDNEFEGGDYVEISRESYGNYIKRTTTPLINDYSSLTIITTLFDILEKDEKDEVLNHTWLTK